MSQPDPRNVFTTENLDIAVFITDWLSKQGVEAEMSQNFKEADGAGLNELSASQASVTFEVLVSNVDAVEQAKQLIVENQESLLQAAQKRDETIPDSIGVECDHCSETVVYPGNMQGSVQECTNCGGYLDVPGGEDEFDWSVVEETISEDDLAEDEADDHSDAWG